jgi:hypothetical protein
MKKSFSPMLYRRAPLNGLILFGILSLAKKKHKATFEKIIKECFSLFPDVFCFSQYAQWPDARKLDRPLRDLRKKKLINGDPQAHFVLTKTGRRLAEEVAKSLGQRELFKLK